MGRDVGHLVSERLSRGESLESVRADLQKSGVAQNEIDYAFYKHGFRQQLHDFFLQQQARGFSRDQIAAHLQKSGYDEADILAALTGAKRQWQASPVLIVGLVAIVALLAGSVYWLSMPKQEQLLDYEVKPLLKDVAAGDELEFTVKVMNFGSDERFDVGLEHRIIEIDTEREIDRLTETLAVETQSSKHASIQVPADVKPGKYALVSRAAYGDKEAEASFIFTVRSALSGTTEGNEQDMTHEPVENAIEPEPIKAENESTGPVAPEKPVVDRLDVVNDLIRAAGNGSSQAETVCRDESELLYRDYCYDKIATRFNDDEYCSRIGSDEKRDFCYVTVAINMQDKSICEKIGKTYVRASCLSM